MDTLIVFSHLRWDFVFQRPQHLLSRLARHYRVLFVEEPVFHEGAPALQVEVVAPNLTVCKPMTPVTQQGFSDAQMPFLSRMMRELGSQHQNPIVWFYTPMALPLLHDLNAKSIIYDCMDELSAFKNPPPQLVEREDALLRIADVVFTGGPSLCNAKKHRHPSVHCFPSSVDVAHFRQALDKNNAHPGMGELDRPRLGFYGVIDERFDAELVRHIADSRPEWQIVLVGPVVKIDPAILPQRDNIHYLGQQPYSALPRFLAGWDVCLMPFALNESTRFISPTKSLEYMAAELPIVSTPVKDVVDLHSDVVEIAADPAAFVDACERLLGMAPNDRQKSIRRMRAKLANTSWDATALRMKALIDEILESDASEPQSWRLAQAASSNASTAARTRE